ncbi:MAG: hypothetical protein ACI4WW_02605 [Candidatus Coprovivens sp.]
MDYKLILEKLEDIKGLTNSELNLIEQLSVKVLPDKVVNQSQRLKGAMINPVTSTNGLPKYLAIRYVAINEVINEIKTSWNNIIPSLRDDTDTLINKIDVLFKDVSSEYDSLLKIENAIKTEITNRQNSDNVIKGNNVSEDYNSLEKLESKIKQEVLDRNNAIDTAINGLIDSAPGTLDTLQEIANALGQDPNFATTITNLINEKTKEAKEYADESTLNSEKKIVGTATEGFKTLGDIEKQIKSITGTSEGGLATLDEVLSKSKEYTDSKVSEEVSNRNIAIENSINQEVIDRNNAIASMKNELLNGAGESFDTLKELAEALGEDPNFATTITNLINEKYNSSLSYTDSKVSEEVSNRNIAIENAKNEVNAQIEEVKQEFEKHPKEVVCSHEVEITGYGEEDCNLAIDDQDVVITKIQGQTRRKSLNLWKGGNLTYTIEYDGYQVFDVANIDAMVGDTITIKFKSSSYTDVLKFLTAIGKEGYTSNTNGVYTLTFTLTSGSNKLFYISGHVGETITFTDIQVNKGNISLPYEPYDNNLVNSKCDFVSTGRNLCDLSTMFKSGWYAYVKNVLLEKGKTYSVDYGVTIPSNLVYNGIELFGWQNSVKTFTFTYTGETHRGNLVITYPNDTLDITILNKFMLVAGDTPLPYEPYVEDTMQCGLELGAFDYHDNIQHITHRQTSEMVTVDGSDDEGWVMYDTNTSGKPRFYISISNNYTDSNTINVSSNWIDVSGTNTYRCNTGIACDSNKINIYIEGITTLEDFKTWLSNNPITFVYKLATETTEENILPSGYKVWYQGMQTQKTDTLPYILTKQYAISMFDQVMNNINVDRGQQKQIDEIKDNKVDKNSLGEFKFLNKNGINIMYAGTDSAMSLLSDYDEDTSTEGTVVGNIDSETLIRGISKRPSYTNGFTTSEIALSTDLTNGKIIPKRANGLVNLEETSITLSDGTASVSLIHNCVYLIYNSEFTFLLRINSSGYSQSNSCIYESTAKPVWLYYYNGKLTLKTINSSGYVSSIENYINNDLVIKKLLDV